MTTTNLLEITINLNRLHLTKFKKCPCRIEDTPENTCPCDEFTTTGKCICGIFKTSGDNK